MEEEERAELDFIDSRSPPRAKLYLELIYFVQLRQRALVYTCTERRAVAESARARSSL